MKRYFKIKQVKKIRVLSEMAFYIIVLSALGILIFEIFLMPSKASPGELNVLVFIKIFPLWLQYFITYSLIIFPIALLIYTASNFTTKGIIYFNIDKIIIKTWRNKITIEVNDLIHIIYVDQTSFLNKSFSYKFILQTIWGKIYRLKLLETERVDEVIKIIEGYKTDRLKISTELVDPTYEFDDP